MIEVDQFFRDLDSGFINFEKGADSFHWNSTDVEVKFEEWSLTVPILLSGSIITYSFETLNGDIEFGVNFYDSNNLETVVQQVSRVPSDVEPISGTLKAPREGRFKFIWDNKFSWFTPKTLAYSIELHQPSFASADKTRSLKSRTLLHAIKDDNSRIEKQHSSFLLHTQELHTDITALSEKLRALEIERNEKISALNSFETHIGELREQMHRNLLRKNGLCIRCLERAQLERVLSYFDSSSQEILTCKYWLAIHTEYVTKLQQISTS